MKNTRVARRYAQALMMTADSPKAIDGIAADLERVKAAFDGSRELRLFIDSPIVSAEKKLAILRELFSSRVGTTTMSFMDLLVEKQREGSLLEIIEQFNVLRDAKYGIINVDVASAVGISPQQEKHLSEKLEQYTKKKVRVRFSLDKALRGGLVVKIGDTVLDSSIKRQLELMREQFIHGHSLN
ncbi:MAG: F0F1 ATP synthase subunit delta [Bacteroidetes bacterium]|nr:F0F1 ATP synthase subunit delta [Bacteroidota bacterium]MCW5894624.1 F0F1 ATP synthase subunit delta [Bacteroidota bacterium]